MSKLKLTRWKKMRAQQIEIALLLFQSARFYTTC